MNNSLDSTLAAKMAAWEIDLFGVADLTACPADLDYEYGNIWNTYSRAISLAAYFPAAIVTQLQQGPSYTYLAYYDIINAHLNAVSLKLANFLTKQGFAAFPVPASQRVSPDKLAGIFSHRWAARLAGLGWIGKSGNLINPQVGPYLRLATVLTDAPLAPGVPLASRCGDCQICQKHCPAQAIKGINWQEGQALAERLNAGACNTYLTEMRQTFGKRICGRCVAFCPFGAKSN
ncbi:MAG: 4Fe-4S dicluster domain-containing protein [Clostridiales bacterium]|jgi:epoxyqueuosine reductase QueG|nr:4Fe-4S dicluster domain-containing protein [Clostridiales bacterium]